MNKKMLLVMGGLLIATHLKAQVVLEALEATNEKCLERVYDKYYGDGVHNYIYCAVQGPNGKKWLNLNLGAEYAKESSPYFNPEAVSTDDGKDPKAFGSLFQRGRRADGHELVTYTDGGPYWIVDRKYPRTTEKQPILTSNHSYVSDVLWNIPNADPSINPFTWSEQTDPCPAGYRVMEERDVQGLVNSFPSNPAPLGFLKLPFIHWDFRSSDTGLVLNSAPTRPFETLNEAGLSSDGVTFCSGGIL